MAKDPAFLFYPNDWIGGTMGMTFEEKGAYMELLMMQFNRGRMTSRMIGQTVGQLWVNIKVKFIEDPKGLYYNERLEEESIKRKNYTESRRNNVSGNNQYSKNKDKKRGHTRGHTRGRMENEDEDVIINKDLIIIKEEFEKIWDLYDKKIGDKEKLIKKWSNLSKSDKTLINEHIPKYKEAQPDKKFRKNLETYLNNNSWLDELISSDKQQVSVYKNIKNLKI